MGMEEDLHMALCVVKVLALVVIASALWSISNSVGSGYLVGAQENSANSLLYLGPGRSTDMSQPGMGGQSSVAYLSNRYEAPVFWNVGDISSYEGQQAGDAKNVIGYDGSAIAWDVLKGAAPPATTEPVGYATSGPGYKTLGYATSGPGYKTLGYMKDPNIPHPY